MKTFSYRAALEPGEAHGVVVVTFPDVPEAISEGRGDAEALRQAEEALGLALLSYPARNLPLPEPASVAGPYVTITPDIAAKLAVIEAFAASGLSKAELGRRIGRDEREVRRILDPMHATRLPALTATLAALGRRLVIGVEDLSPAA